MTTECKFCGQPAEGHMGVHPFVAVGEAGRLPPPKEAKRLGANKQGAVPPAEGSKGTPSTQTSGADLVLRVALLKAGVLKPSDLDDAEEALKGGHVLVIRG